MNPGIEVAVEQLAHSFGRGPDTVAVLDHLTFRLAPGESVALVGPSGCGKSTLIGLLAGLLQPESGRITLGGLPPRVGRRELAVIFQRDYLLPWRTALENALLPAELGGSRRSEMVRQAVSLLSRWGLERFLHTLPAELSGGMRQRVALCRALMQEPEGLLMDEPFASLDPFTREQMNGELERLWLERPMTLLLVTHDVGEAVLLADRVLVLSAAPARLRADVTIPVPRPRSRLGLASPELAPWVRQIWRLCTAPWSELTP